MPRPANPTLRDDILAAALRLVEEKGVAGVTMREVAGALGYSENAIYQQFASKESLLLALQLQAGDLLTAEMEEARQEPALEAQLQAMGRRYLQFGLNNAAYYRLIFQDSVPGLSLTPEQLTRMRQSWAVMRETLGAWVEARGLQGLDVDQEANVLWAMAHGITSLALAGRLPSSNQAEIFALWEMAAARWATGVLRLQPSPVKKSKQKPARRKKAVSLRRPRRSKGNA